MSIQSWSGPRFIALDLSHFIAIFRHLPGMQFLYQRYPVKELISTILSVNQYIGYNDTIWFEMEKRFNDAMCNDPRLDPNTMDLFFEHIAFAVDAYIRERVPSSIDMSEYTFERWVDATTIIMKRDETVEIYRDCGANDYIPPMHQFHPLGLGQSWMHP